MASEYDKIPKASSNFSWLRLTLGLLRVFFTVARDQDRIPSPSSPRNGSPNAEVLAQYHAAEYACERNSVDVWKTLQYPIVPLIFGLPFFPLPQRSQAFSIESSSLIPFSATGGSILNHTAISWAMGSAVLLHGTSETSADRGWT